MIRQSIHCLGVLCLALAQPVSGAGDADAGAAKAVTCAGCHGPRGVSPNDLWPNLAGQQRRYLIKQLKAFRDGDRSDPIMQTFASNLNDQDIEDIAAWYAGLGCTADGHEKE